MAIGDLHVLVAEDHDFQRRTLVRMLASLGVKRVSDAADGKAALEIFGGPDPVDVIISDLEMPGMDGMEFMRHVGAAERPVSVILSSALEPALVSSVEAMTRAYGITLLGTLEKPVTQEKLTQVLGRYSPQQRRAPRPAAGPAIPLDEIRRALAAREFEPFFQPKVSLADGSVVGAEALARWRHPQKGLIAPYAFIPQMEAGGLIDELTWVILERSAALCREWVAGGLQASVSVNLSLKSLAEAGLAERITERVAAQDIAAKHVVLEITETAAMTDVAKALENLTRLRMKGFQLSIDDYGTGYSSMQQLARVPFTELKIDQSFVFSAVEKEASKVILASSLDMAKKLKLKAVAEGVETRAHWNLLQELGCDIAQGYFIAKPMEASAFRGWALEWQPPG